MAALRVSGERREQVLLPAIRVCVGRKKLVLLPALTGGGGKLEKALTEHFGVGSEDRGSSHW